MQSSEVDTPSDSEKAAVAKFLTALRAAYQHPQMASLKRFMYQETFPVAESFINVAVIEEQEAKTNERSLQGEGTYFRDGRINSYEAIHKPKRPIPLVKMFQPEGNENSRHILVEGRAGIGKSVLCQYLANQWAMGSSSQLPSLAEEFAAVIWLPLRRLLASSADTIAKVVYEQCFLRKDKRTVTVADVEKALEDLKQCGKVLYLLDGYDEVANVLSEESTLIKDLLHELFEQADWLLTSRPYYVDSQYVGSDYRHLELIGISDEDIPKYVHRFFVDFKAEEKEQGLQCLLETNANLKGIAHVPINLELICSSFLAGGLNQEEHLTMTALYEDLLGNLAKRHLIRQEVKNVEDLSMQRIVEHEQCRGIITFLEHLAWEAMQQAALIISPSQYQPLVDRCVPPGENYKRQVEAIFKQFGLLAGIGHYARSTLDQGYYFIHLTFQEYFAARYIAHHLDELAEFIKEHKYDPRYEIVWWFVAGILRNTSERTSKFYAVMLSGPEDLTLFTEALLMMRCLEESELKLEAEQENSLLDKIAKGIAIVCSKSRREYGYYSLERILGDYLTLSPHVMHHSLILSLLKIVSKHPDREVKRTVVQILSHIQNSSDKIVALLIAIAQDKDAQSRAAATWALGELKIHSAEVIDRIVQLTKDEDLIHVRYLAIEALRKIKPATPEAMARLGQLTQNKDKTVQEIATEALGKLKSVSPEFIFRLVQLTQDKDKNVRAAATRALGKIEPAPPEIIAHLVQLTQDKDDYVRAVAISALGALKPAPPEVIAYLVRLTRNKYWYIRTAAIDALGALKSALPEVISRLLRLTQNKCGRIRVTAINALSEFQSPSPEVITCLVELTQDKDNHVRAVATRALGTIKSLSTKVVARLVQLIQDQDDYVRRAAIDALSEFQSPSPEVITCLVKLTQDKTDGVRWDAFRALAKLKPVSPEAISCLVQLTQDQDRHARVAAISAWGELKSIPPEVIACLVQLTQDKDDGLRAVATDVLGNLKTSSPEAIAQLLHLAQQSPWLLHSPALLSLSFSQLITYYQVDKNILLIKIIVVKSLLEKTALYIHKGYLYTGKENTEKEKPRPEKVAFASFRELQQFIRQLEAEVQARILVQKIAGSFDELILIREGNGRAVDFITMGQPIESEEEVMRKHSTELSFESGQEAERRIDDEVIRAKDIVKTSTIFLQGPEDVTISPLQTNKAHQHFIGTQDEEDQRRYEVWYSERSILYLLHSTAKTVATAFLPYVFINQATPGCSFSEQFRELMVLRSGIGQDICFIATEPSSLHAPHFVYGVLTGDILLLINPVGLSKHHDFNEALAELHKRYKLTVYLSVNLLQQESGGLVSCGPICVELALGILAQTKEEWANSLRRLVKSGKGKEQESAWLHKVDISPLLPPTLQDLSRLSEAAYQERLIQIRAAHGDRLIAISSTVPGEVSEDTFWNQCENADIQIVMNQLCLEKKTIIEVQDTSAFKRLAGRRAARLTPIDKKELTHMFNPTPLSEAVPAGISCQYTYAPSISRTDIVIEIEQGATLPPKWDLLLRKKLMASSASLSHLTEQETVLFKSLISNVPSLSTNRPIEVKTLLENCSVKVRFLGLKPQGNATPVQALRNKDKEKAKKDKAKAEETWSDLRALVVTYEALQQDQAVKLKEGTVSPLLSALLSQDQTAIARARKACEKDTLLIMQQDDYGNNALHFAALQNDLTILQLGTQYGLDLTATNSFGMNALHFAVIKNNLSVVDWLLQKNKHLSKSPLTLRISKKTYCCSPLQLAVLFNQAKTLDCLLSYAESLYFDAHTTTELGNVLHAAILINNIPLLQHLLQKQEVKSKFLESVNLDGQTPLAFAALLGHDKAIMLLQQAGADVNRSCQGNWRALHYAVKGRRVHTVNTLFWLRADINALNEDNVSALHLAKKLEKKARTFSKTEKAQWYSLVKNRLANIAKETEGSYGLIDVKERGAYRNLVIQGNSLNGIPYQGALEVLQDRGVLYYLKRVASTSSGTLIATLVALNFPPEEMGRIIGTMMAQCLELEKLVFDLPALKRFLGELWNEIDQLQQNNAATRYQLQQFIVRLTEKCCVEKSDKFLSWFDTIIQKKLEQDGVKQHGTHYLTDFTFGRLRELINQGTYGYRHLYIVTTNIDNKKQPECIVFNSEETRWSDVKVIDVIRASMLLPGIFEPYAITYPSEEDPSQRITRHFVDGGLIVNYPIDFFDKVFYVDPHAVKKWRYFPRFNEETLGLRSKAAPSLVQHLRDLSLSLLKEEAPDVKQLLSAVLQIFYFAEEWLLGSKEDPALRSITLEIDDVNTADLSPETKTVLIASAREATEQSSLIKRLPTPLSQRVSFSSGVKEKVNDQSEEDTSLTTPSSSRAENNPSQSQTPNLLQQRYLAASSIKLLFYNTPLPIADSYVNLAIVKEREQLKKEKMDRDFPPSEVGEDKERTQTKTFREHYLNRYEAIYGAKETILPEKLFELTAEEKQAGKYTSPQRLVVLGRAGIGKTTLCQHLAYRWAGGDLWPGRWDWVFQISLRHLLEYPATAVSLSQVIQQECLPHLSVAEVETLLGTADPVRILYLLDGYDEVASLAQDTGNRGQLLQCLLEQKSFILTSRPYYTHQLNNIDRQLENIGFQQQEIEQYIKKFFTRLEKPHQADGLLALLLANPSIRGIAPIPICLELLCSAWEMEAQELDTTSYLTMTILYRKVIANLFKRYLTKYHVGYLLARYGKESADDFSVEDIEQDNQCQAYYHFLEQVAWLGLQTPSLIIGSNHLVNTITARYPIPNTERDQFSEAVLHQVGLLKETSSQRKNLLDRAYYFIHLTFQEFLAARYVVNHFEEQQEFLIKHKYHPHYELVWWFVAGLMRSEPLKLSVFFKQLQAFPRDLIGLSHQCLLIRCLEESELRVEKNQRKELLKELSTWLRWVCENKMRNYGLKPLAAYLGLSRRVYTHPVLQTTFAELLTSPGGETRINLVHLIGDILSRNPGGESRVLVQLTGDENPEVREAVAEALGKLGSAIPEMITELLRLVRDEDIWVRRAAAEALGKLGLATPEIITALLRLALDLHSDVRKVAREALGELGITPEVIPELLRLVRDEDISVRSAAAEALGALGSATPEVIPELLRLVHDKGWIVRRAAAAALGKLGSAIPEVISGLLRLVRDEDSDVRGVAAVALAQLGSATPKVISELLRLAGDNYSDVRCMAAVALAELGSATPEVISELLRLAGDNYSDVRGVAALALVKLGSVTPKVISELLRLAGSKDSDARGVAAVALAKLGSATPEVITELLCLTGDGDSNLKIAAVEALGKLDSATPEVITELLRLAGANKYSVVRSVAAEALSSLSTHSNEVVAQLLQAYVSDLKPKFFAECELLLIKIVSFKALVEYHQAHPRLNFAELLVRKCLKDKVVLYVVKASCCLVTDQALKPQKISFAFKEEAENFAQTIKEVRNKILCVKTPPHTPSFFQTSLSPFSIGRHATDTAANLLREQTTSALKSKKDKGKEKITSEKEFDFDGDTDDTYRRGPI